MCECRRLGGRIVFPVWCPDGWTMPCQAPVFAVSLFLVDFTVHTFPPVHVMPWFYSYYIFRTDFENKLTHKGGNVYIALLFKSAKYLLPNWFFENCVQRVCLILLMARPHLRWHFVHWTSPHEIASVICQLCRLMRHLFFRMPHTKNSEIMRSSINRVGMVLPAVKIKHTKTLRNPRHNRPSKLGQKIPTNRDRGNKSAHRRHEGWNSIWFS